MCYSYEFEYFSHSIRKFPFIVFTRSNLWFDTTALYRIMRETDSTELLPQYYFKGLYITHDAPHGFYKIYTIPEIIYSNGHPVDSWQKEIYEINWSENKSKT